MKVANSVDQRLVCVYKLQKEAKNMKKLIVFGPTGRTGLAVLERASNDPGNLSYCFHCEQTM